MEVGVLLERDDELALLDATLDGCRAGAGRLIVIEGPAGIGKSSVVVEVRSHAENAGFQVLRARGSELETAFPYGIVRQLFEPVMVHLDERERADVFGGAAAHAARLFDAPPGGEQATANGDTDFALVHGLYWLTVNLAESGPLLVAIDDLQWTDGASLRWLSYLARRLDGLRVCALGAVRPLEAEDPTLTDLLADPSTELVRPPALSAAAVTDLVRGRLGSTGGDDEFGLACLRATGGNPLLVHELVRTLADSGIEPTADSVAIVDRLAPDTVTRSVKARLARLPAESVAVARAVAVLGDGADGSHVAAFAGLDPRALAFAAAALARVELLVPEIRFQFVHPLVRTAVYASIPVHERAQEHARAAQVLTEARASLEAVAAQLLLAPPTTVDDAATTLRDAARQAADRGAPESAARYLQRALDERVEDEQRGELLLDLAGSELRLGRTTAIERLRAALPYVQGEQRRQRAHLELALASNWLGNEEDAARSLKQALDEQPEDNDLRRRLEASWLTHALATQALSDDARRRLASIEFDNTEGVGARMLRGARAFHDATAGRNRERAVADAEQVLSAIEPGSGDTSIDAYALFVLLCGDRLEQGIRFIDAALERTRHRADIFNFATYLATRSIFRYATGSLVEAEADSRGALETLAQRDVLFVPIAFASLTQVLVERRAIDEAVGLLTMAEEELGQIPERFSYVQLWRSRGLVSAARGEHRAALEQALKVGEMLASVEAVNPAYSYPGWRSEAARAHHALGNQSNALAFARDEVTLAQAWGAPRPVGRALRTLGSIEGGSEGLTHLQDAVDVLEHSPARLEHAYALTDLGGALRRSNQRAAARDPLRLALDLAHRCGAKLLAERAHEELISSGARPRRVKTTGVDALTASERRVAAMAADGLSNREIAQSLFVTLRTVEMHLSNAFQKLDIASRTQLASALATKDTQ